jgi:ubiquinone/menaquinone biosynthesis C-methylase UbiE
MEVRILGRDIHIPLNGLNVSRQLEYKLLMQYLDLQGSERLLDVACGDGYWTAKMIPQVGGVVGFDLNLKRLQRARLQAGTMQGAIRNDAHHLPFKDGAFDCAVGICILEHFEDDLGALGEMRRVMRAGGRLALSVDSFTYPGFSEAEKARHMEKFSVVHHYTVEILKEKLSRSGFELDRWTYLLKSPVSAALYRLALRAPKLAYGLFPISYPLSLWSERRSKNQTSGYKLAVSARAA